MRTKNAPLSEYTRFGIGGPADVLVEASTPAEFIAELQSAEPPRIILGAGTNLVVSDEGYRGTVLRYRGKTIIHQDGIVRADSGADLEALVLYCIENGLAGLESMMRIPGWVGGAVYGNAGAYGQSIHEVLTRVEVFDGVSIKWLENADCDFSYRSSGFKKQKNRLILSAEFKLREGDPASLKARAREIQDIRDAKFPPSMKCAGSIFKNCFLADLPESAQKKVPAQLVRDGKVPSAFFLEQVGAKGTVNGGIRVADYHANLIYNAGGGTASEIVEIIDDLKKRVQTEFRFTPEEEVQFVGFAGRQSY